ncbi:MAG: response regulator [Lachnospiraceae bacterium]|nr:response regulator [Lachnospiraceae bacterium]
MIDTILVVEDEKMIRQGIATMIKRCGTQVGEVLECPDGEKALEILKTTHVDLVFTDIRMPKMNGIQLAQEIQQLDDTPLVVAISGYDDFDYAVQMLRSGVKEYILKPVEREKIAEVVARLDEEIARKKKDRDLTENTSNRLLKYLLLDKDATPGDLEDLEKLLTDKVGKEYYVMIGKAPVAPEGIRISSQSEMICIIPAGQIETVIEENGDAYAGLSDGKDKITELKGAYEQACARRKRAFLTGEGLVREDGKEPPAGLAKEAKQLTDPAALSAAVQRIGVAEEAGIKKEWDRFFTAAERGYLKYDAFEDAIRTFFSEFMSVYKCRIPEELICPLTFNHLDAYRQEFYGFLKGMSGQLSAGSGDKKMREAVAYIQENYMKDLSMTVVSNEVSMNYTLFSTQFKQYTGSSFVSYVRDLRITEAKRLLAETDMRITEIGTAVGYESEKHFLKSFKSEVGVTPSEYRKNASR